MIILNKQLKQLKKGPWNNPQLNLSRFEMILTDQNNLSIVMINATQHETIQSVTPNASPYAAKFL
jgi:hypothetical protein